MNISFSALIVRISNSNIVMDGYILTPEGCYIIPLAKEDVNKQE